MIRYDGSFFDRDRTININYGHVYKIEDLKLIKGVPEIINNHNNANVLVIIVTKQARITKGLCTVDDMQRLNQLMNEQPQEH